MSQEKKHSPYAVNFFYTCSGATGWAFFTATLVDTNFLFTCSGAAGWASFTVTLVDMDFLFKTTWATTVGAVLLYADVVLSVAVCFGISVAGFVTFPSDARRR
jgi:hypothetical protein